MSTKEILLEDHVEQFGVLVGMVKGKVQRYPGVQELGKFLFSFPNIIKMFLNIQLPKIDSNSDVWWIQVFLVSLTSVVSCDYATALVELQDPCALYCAPLRDMGHLPSCPPHISSDSRLCCYELQGFPIAGNIKKKPTNSPVGWSWAMLLRSRCSRQLSPASPHSIWFACPRSH